MKRDRPPSTGDAAPADVEHLLDLLEAEHPDPVDLFEDELARRLGIERHPAMTCDLWRRRRVEAIEAAGSRADVEARRVEADFERGTAVAGT